MLGFVFSSAPHGSTAGREGLDALLATANYTEEIAVFFVADGVGQLLKNQEVAPILTRNYIPTFKLLPMYEIEQLYVCQYSLAERGLSECELVLTADLLTPAQLTAKLARCSKVLHF